MAITKAQMDAEIDAQMPDNTSNIITPAVQRGVLHDMVTFTSQSPGPIFSVKNFGAVGDGITDDSAAIKATVNAATALLPRPATSRGAVYFPAGIYRITQSAVLTQNITNNALGVLYFGDGPDASVLRLDTTGAVSDIWLYDNGSNPRMQDNVFSDLGFQGCDPSTFVTFSDIPIHANAFRIWATNATGGHEQNFHWHNCNIELFNTVFLAEGDNTASENSWSQCNINKIRGSVVVLNNAQSLNHSLSQCELTNIFGNAFVISTQGGGAIKMSDCSIILASDTGVDTYFISNPTGGSTGLNGSPFTFTGLRFELRGNNTKLVNTSDQTQLNFVFRNCFFNDQATVDKTNWCLVQSYSTLMFSNCSFFEQNGGRMLFVVGNAGGTTGFGQDGAIIFDSCGFDIDWSDRCSAQQFKGRITARNCYGTNVGLIPNSGAGYGAAWAHDFDIHWIEPTPGLYTGWTSTHANMVDGGSASDNGIRMKTAQFQVQRNGWPENNLELTLRLPRYAIIESIHLRKPAGGGTATVCTINVSRNDKSGTPHLISNSAAYNTAQTGDVSNYYYQVGSTDNERTLRLYASASVTGGIQGGLCFVNYY